MRIAIVHDHLNQWGGAERVISALHEIYPQAPIYTVVADPKLVAEHLPDADVRTSGLQSWPLAVKKLRWYLPFIPAALEQLDLRGYDIVLSSSSAYAKGIITQPDTKHVCYCHTPTRYLWNDTHVYQDDLPVGRAVKSFLPLYLKRMRLWDRLAADRVDHFVANSNFIRERIQKYYNKPSEVIYPPVEINRFQPVENSERGDYFLSVGRLRPYKKVDVLIEAFNKLGYHLKIIGTGDEMKRLQRLARGNIEFLGYISDAEKSELMSRAQAFLHPQEEDFGITAVESLAAGTPVLAYGRGGAEETVQPGVNGEYFGTQTAEGVIDVVRHFDINKYDPHKIRETAQRFDRKRFQNEIRELVWDIYSQNKKQKTND